MIYNDLTPGQQALHQLVEQHDGDGRAFLHNVDAPAVDKAAVAEVLGGPGAGREFQP